MHSMLKLCRQSVMLVTRRSNEGRKRLCHSSPIRTGSLNLAVRCHELSTASDNDLSSHLSGPAISTDAHGAEIELLDTISVTFVTKEGRKIDVKGRPGEHALSLAHRCGVHMEGACEASLACTTCHCYVDSMWHVLPEPSETEEDLLDMAPFLEEHSRLGCQIILQPELDGLVLRLPRATKNFYVDGHKPMPHCSPLPEQS